MNFVTKVTITETISPTPQALWERIAVLEYRVQEQQAALKNLQIGIQGLEDLLNKIAEHPMGLLC